jgi:hypothetical protein
MLLKKRKWGGMACFGRETEGWFDGDYRGISEIGKTPN